ncbi:MAG: DUF2334 domain-containing protein [Acidobacteriota bacterium]
MSKLARTDAGSLFRRGRADATRPFPWFGRQCSILGLLFLSPTLILAGFSQSQSYRQQDPRRAALILYDGPDSGYSEGLISSRHIANLLGHFSIRSNIQSVASYSKGQMDQYDLLFFAGNYAKTVLPKPFLQDVSARTRTVCWVNRHIPQLLHHPTSELRHRLGFTYVDYRDDEGFDTVLYKGTSLRKSDYDLNLVRIEDRSRVRVWAHARNENGLWPYILQSGNFWYVADSPFSFVEEGDRYLAFCDVLHDLVGDLHPTKRQALVRIEDVSIDSDPVELKKIADYLAAAGVPFQIALIPIFKDPAKNLEVHLSDRPQVVQAIKYMVARGGTIVLHGVTHQYRGVSGDDFEFWDDLQDRAIALNSPSSVRDRFEAGLTECFRNDLYPVAWETPHYAASYSDQQVFGEFFSHANERRMVLDRQGTQQYFPYLVTDLTGQQIVPENLGFVSIDNPNPQPLIEDARRMRVVRDGIPSFFFHSFVSLDHLKRIVQGIKGAGYQFVSLKTFGCQVRSRKRSVQCSPDTMELTLDGEYLRLAILDGSENVVQEAISDDRLSGRVSRSPRLEAGQIAVMEGIPERRVHRQSSWHQTWTQRVASWLSSPLQPERIAQKPVGEATLITAGTNDLPLKNNQESYSSALRAFGIRTHTIPVERLASGGASLTDVVFVPYPASSRLPPVAQQILLNHVNEGGKLILDGESSLSTQLGIGPGERRLPLAFLQNPDFPDAAIHWDPAVAFSRFVPPLTSKSVLVDLESEGPVAVVSRRGRGSFLFLGPLFDPESRLGYTRYPFLFQTLRTHYGLQNTARRNQVEVYFDPGLRPGASLERLVRSWKDLGVRIVYTAAWAGDYQQWSFDYAYFIELCHKYGILVYAWFELPQVSEKFWNRYPHWREKTATGEDGRVGWRLLMNLYNPECRRAAFDYVEETVRKYSWDGVNVAELNFDTNHGPADPTKYVPMNDDVRKAFQDARGFDPASLFRPQSPNHWGRNPAALRSFERFRSQMITDWHREILERLGPYCSTEGLELVITMLDSLHSQTVIRDTGVDSQQILSLMERYPFTLQVEDPAEFWAGSPDRYSRFVETYLDRVRPRERLIFDLNVVPRHLPAGSRLPTAQASGIELAQMLYSAAQASGRVAIYAESTLLIQDFEMLASVLASGTEVEEESHAIRIATPNSVWIPASPSERYQLDGKDWPFVDGSRVLVPAGKHVLTHQQQRSRLFSFEALDLKVVSFGGEILEANTDAQGLHFRYQSPTRVAVGFSRQPVEIKVDQKRYPSRMFHHRGTWTIILPSGEHRVEVVSRTPVHLFLDLTSLMSSSLIVLFGFTVGGLLAGLYASVLVVRWWRNGNAAWKRKFPSPP